MVTVVLNFKAVFDSGILKSKFPNESMPAIFNKNEPEVIGIKKRIKKILIIAYGQFLIICFLIVIFNLVLKKLI